MRTNDRHEDFDIELTTRPYSRLVTTFYREYARIFVLPDERESLTGFRHCLRLNGPRGDSLHRRFGTSREFIGVFRTPGGEAIAGTNFICFPMPGSMNVATVHSIYAFVVPSWRRRGLLRRIYQTIERTARQYASECGLNADAELILFGEQHDPFRMTLRAFEEDTAASGLDQFERMAVWRRLGARILAFRYVQPALSRQGEPDSNLFLRVIFFRDGLDRANGSAERNVDPRIVREHLRRFFGITVLKGRCDPASVPEIAFQEDVLERAIATGQMIAADQMPTELVLSGWKARVAEALSANHPRDATVGSLLGVASILDSHGRSPMR